MTDTEIARWAHEINRTVQGLIGEEVSPSWEEAPEWQKASALEGVAKHRSGTLSPKESHQSWLLHKAADGWGYGFVKDAEKKEHPCFVPYEALPVEQRLKDHLFAAVVAGLEG